MNVNQIINVEVLSGESPPVTEPVALQEVKDYLRLEGFADDGSGITPETPLELTLLEGELTVTSALLIGKSILALTRSGQSYYEADAFGGYLVFLFDDSTGLITFDVAGNPGGEPIGILYGAAGTSSGNVFGFDDDLITDLIAEGRQWCEQFIGGDHLFHSILPRSIEVTALNQAGYLNLPGPVTGDITVTDQNGNTLSDQVFVGTLWPKMVTCHSCRIVLSYSVGYSTYPEWIKNAIKAYVADHYEYRGDDKPAAPNERVKQKLRQYRRVPAWG